MQDLLLLHGAIGSNAQLIPLQQKLEKSFIVHNLNFGGHGDAGTCVNGFSIETFANDMLKYIQQNHIVSANIFGYSMGGYVAMYLAKKHPERIAKLITLATKFYWDGETAAKEVQMLQPATIEAKLPAFAEVLKQRHGNWQDVLEQTAVMLENMGEENPLKLDEYATIQHPCLLMLGDKDKMVSLNETVDVFKQLPNAQLCILPSTKHPIEQVNVDMLAYHIKAFLTNG